MCSLNRFCGKTHLILQLNSNLVWCEVSINLVDKFSLVESPFSTIFFPYFRVQFHPDKYNVDLRPHCLLMRHNYKQCKNEKSLIPRVKRNLSFLSYRIK